LFERRNSPSVAVSCGHWRGLEHGEVVLRHGELPVSIWDFREERCLRMHIIIPKPHVKPEHVKHTAGLTIVAGTILEAAHLFYPIGLAFLCVGGLIAVYEPYIVHEVKEVFLETDA
jgi:hypothetical protein